MFFVSLGCGLDVDLWWEGGSVTTLTDFQAPRHNRSTPTPHPHPPCRGCCQITHSIHETNTNYPCSPLRGLQGVVQDFW